MAPSIDPASITHESIPAVLGALLAMAEQNKRDHNDIIEILQRHEDCLQIFNISRCKILPWLGRNRWVIATFLGAFSLWFASIDWLNRWVQWSFFPPRACGGKAGLSGSGGRYRHGHFSPEISTFAAQVYLHHSHEWEGAERGARRNWG
jgi:hypothetical protein